MTPGHFVVRRVVTLCSPLVARRIRVTKWCSPGGQTRAASTTPDEWHQREGGAPMSFHDWPDEGNRPHPVQVHPPVAIPTNYRGCRFRSRLEARWAVFFDHLGIGWTYEPQGYLIGGVSYLPDFLLECGTWVEVKGHEGALDKDLMRTAALALPQMPASAERGPRLLLLGSPYMPYVDPVPGDAGWLGIDPDGRGAELTFGSYGFGNFDKRRRPWWFAEREDDDAWLLPHFEEGRADTTAAYAAGNGARFEHGERGA